MYGRCLNWSNRSNFISDEKCHVTLQKTSAVSEHCQATGHNINSYNVNVVSEENYTIKRRIKEAASAIKQRKGLDLPAIYNPLLGIRNLSVSYSDILYWNLYTRCLNGLLELSCSLNLCTHSQTRASVPPKIPLVNVLFESWNLRQLNRLFTKEGNLVDHLLTIHYQRNVYSRAMDEII